MNAELVQDIAIGFSALHTLGAGLGAFSVLYAEWEYINGHLGNRLAVSERRHLYATFFALRWGLSLVLFSALALIIMEYTYPLAPSIVSFVPFWVSNTLALVVVLSGFLLSRKRIPFPVGGGAALTAWWYMFLLQLMETPSWSYTELLLSYLYTTALVAFLLAFLRGIARAHAKCIPV